ncbi:MAG: GntR family transcriptional regulator [Eubacteriales bacterium]|nr:GntR family transcriptional regulator [Eubacteriales bacterium]
MSHKPLREVVYEQLKMQILEGKITPGTRMMEVSLAEELGVSRTPVREAIRKLAKDGLVIIEPRKGAYAAEISAKDINDTLIVRENLEALASSIAAKVVTSDEIEELERMIDDYEVAVNEGNIDVMIEKDANFHRHIIKYSGNKTLMSLYEKVQELTLRFRYLYYEKPSRYTSMPDEHRTIIKALKSGDADMAYMAANYHVAHLKNSIREEVGENDDSEGDANRIGAPARVK